MTEIYHRKNKNDKKLKITKSKIQWENTIDNEIVSKENTYWATVIYILNKKNAFKLKYSWDLIYL